METKLNSKGWALSARTTALALFAMAILLPARGSLLTSPLAEQAGAAGPAAVISNVAVSNVTTTAATFTWNTNIPATSKAEVWKQGSSTRKTSSKSAKVTSHSITMTGLSASTTYNFQVSSKANNLWTVSTVSTFVTGGSIPTPTPTPSPTPVPTPTPTPIPSLYDVGFSTFVGGSGYEQARDGATDSQGNVYLVGGTDSGDFPRTLGQNPGGGVDAFVTKFSPTGQVLWSQRLGGPNYDRAYAVEIDGTGNIYVTGRAGRSFPLLNPLQDAFNGYYTGDAYGEQNTFLVKLDAGGTVLWSTYVGTADMARDMAIDQAGNIYLASNYYPALGQAAFPSAWFANGYQSTPPGGGDVAILKVDTNGTGVQWATYLGGSGAENPKISIRVDSQGNVVILTDTVSTDAPMLNAYQTTNRGATDAYLAKLGPDGSNLLWSTYFGGSGYEYNETHHLGLDAQDNVYLAVMSQSSDAPTTVGAYDRTYNGDSTGGFFHAWGDALVAKFNPTGQLVASTYVGGTGGDGPQGLGVDAAGNVYFSGGTMSNNFPITIGAPVTAKRGGEDIIAVRLSADFSRLDYSTYIGTTTNDEGRVSWADQDGTFYVGCEVQGNGLLPLQNAFQPTFSGGTHDACITKFAPRP